MRFKMRLVVALLGAFALFDFVSTATTIRVTTEDEGETSTIAMTSMRMYRLDPLPKRKSTKQTSEVSTEVPTKKNNDKIDDSPEVKSDALIPMRRSMNAHGAKTHEKSDDDLKSIDSCTLNVTKTEDEVMKWLKSLSNDSKQRFFKKICNETGYCTRNRRKCSESRKRVPSPIQLKKSLPPPPPPSIKDLRVETTTILNVKVGENSSTTMEPNATSQQQQRIETTTPTTTTTAASTTIKMTTESIDITTTDRSSLSKSLTNEVKSTTLANQDTIASTRPKKDKSKCRRKKKNSKKPKSQAV